MRSTTRKAKRGKYSVKAHSEKNRTWYMKTLWEMQYKFADATVNGLTEWYYSSKFTCYYSFITFYIVKDNIYFLPYPFYKPY